MIQYKDIESLSIDPINLKVRYQALPELVHLDDPAWTVMRDFRLDPPQIIPPNESIDNALMEMKIQGTHLLLVADTKGSLHGILSTEDILGEKPITIIQSRRIERPLISLEMIMSPIDEVVIFDIDTVQKTKVGNVVETLKKHNRHYALVVQSHDNNSNYQLIGLFSTSQISKQLHMEIASKDSETSISKLTGSV